MMSTIEKYKTKLLDKNIFNGLFFAVTFTKYYRNNFYFKVNKNLWIKYWCSFIFINMIFYFFSKNA